MSAKIEAVDIRVEEESLSATLLEPETKMPGILFVHGWGGNQQRDLLKAEKIAGLGCICLTFDLRGHEKTMHQRDRVSRADNLADVLAAYDHLASHPAIDSGCMAVIGTSYGGYLAALLTAYRPVRWAALRAPALYWDDQWQVPKALLDRGRLTSYRKATWTHKDNQVLDACAKFTGDVLIVESETDDYVPHATIMSYRTSFLQAHSLTHRIIEGADHALSGEKSQEAYGQILRGWITEMVIGSRIKDPLDA